MASEPDILFTYHRTFELVTYSFSYASEHHLIIVINEWSKCDLILMASSRAFSNTSAMIGAKMNSTYQVPI